MKKKNKYTEIKENGKRYWINKWIDNEDFFKNKKIRFNNIDSKLNISPKKILDIGCGLAVESELFQKKYGSELYLLEGSASAGSSATRFVDFGSTDSMNFYTPVDVLEDNWKQRNIRYELVRAEKPEIPQDIKFDLICSHKSCGFHYPLSAYVDIFKNNSNTDTVFLFDLRPEVEQGITFEVIELIAIGNKEATAKLKIHFD